LRQQRQGVIEESERLWMQLQRDMIRRDQPNQQFDLWRNCPANCHRRFNG
jgi:hypothetical protein